MRAVRSMPWIAAVVALGAVACGGNKQVAVQPPPEAPRTVVADDDAERARRAEEERMRLERERQRAAEEAARARETLAERVYFDFDRSDIRPDMRPVLDAKIRILLAQRSIQLQVEGHADERGSDEYNLALGMRRAVSVKNYLANLGVDGSRIAVRSFGEEKPLIAASHPDAWAKNRRAEFIATGGVAASDR